MKKLTKEEQLGKLVTELYLEYDRTIIPLYPRVFVRVLPREQQVGSIIVPDMKQNKTQIEAIVLATYAPFWRTFRYEDKSSKLVIETTEGEGRCEFVECSVKPGDHITVPHHCGMPDPVFDEKKYRVIREDEISLRLTYEHPTPVDALTSFLCNNGGNNRGGVHGKTQVDVFLEEYELYSKALTSKTVSGR